MTTLNQGRSLSSTLFTSGQKREVKEQTTIFSTNESGDKKPDFVLPTYVLNKQPDSDIKDFLKRPVVIGTYTWTQGTNINQVFYPWSAFFANAAIQTKLDYYYLVRGVLKITIVVTASPGLYGAAYCSYQPMSNYNPAPIVETSTYDGWMVPFSQRPGIDINVQENTGGEMHLPFVYEREWLDVTSETACQNMGKFTLRNFTSLRAITAASQDVTIRVFASMAEVELSVPTNAVAQQSGEIDMHNAEESHEFNETEGAISKPASAIASVANVLSNVPVIGPFAKATSIAAEGVASIAKMFGYSNPPVIEDVKPFKNSSIPPVATSDICQPFERLTLDAKNELTLDNSCRGYLSVDELNIQEYCKRNSFLDYTTWSQSDTAGTALWASRVTPELWRRDGVTNYKIQPTFMGNASLCFKYWRGNIVFGVRVVASKMHTGSLRLCYDPRADILTSAPDYAVVTNKVIDITTDTTTEIEIPFSNTKGFLECEHALTTQKFGLGALSGGSDTQYENGTFRVEVNTQQSCYAADSDITLMFYAYAKDIQFMAPRNLGSNISYYPLQSDDVGLATTDSEELITDTVSDEDKMNLVYGGERVPSFRTLFHRMCYSRSVPCVPDSTNLYAITHSIFNRYPLFNGYDPDGINSAAGTLTPASDFPYNFVQNLPFNLITSCFLGSYGSVNWMVIEDGTDNRSVIILERNRDGAALSDTRYNFSTYLSTTATSDQKNRFFNAEFYSGASGRNVAKNNLAPNQINAPWYSDFKFRDNTAQYRTEGTSVNGTDHDAIEMKAFMKPLLENTQNTVFHFYFSAGVDFNTIYLLNVPTWQYLSALPAGKDT
jgi:hypothetical protein